MTAEHLKPMLETEVDSRHLYEVAVGFARGEAPQEVVNALRMGRMTALRKDDGGVRCIVVGDVCRRLVVRTIAKQFSSRGESATAPFQFALSTRAGCECLTHVIRGATGIDLWTESGAYDSVSSNLMFASLHRMVDGAQICCRLGGCSADHHPSICGRTTWETLMTSWKERAEKGDPLMPMLFSHGTTQCIRGNQRTPHRTRIFLFLFTRNTAETSHVG